MRWGALVGTTVARTRERAVLDGSFLSVHKLPVSENWHHSVSGEMEEMDGWVGCYVLQKNKKQNGLGVFWVFSLARRVIIMITRLRNEDQNNRREGIPNRNRDEDDSN